MDLGGAALNGVQQGARGGLCAVALALRGDLSLDLFDLLRTARHCPLGRPPVDPRSDWQAILDALDLKFVIQPKRRTIALQHLLEPVLSGNAREK